MKTPQVPAMPGMTPLGVKTASDAAKALVKQWPRREDWSETWWRLHPELMPSKATDQKTVAERQWQKGKLAPKPQQQCDHGLFSDDANQKELF